MWIVDNNNISPQVFCFFTAISITLFNRVQKYTLVYIAYIIEKLINTVCISPKCPLSISEYFIWMGCSKAI